VQGLVLDAEALALLDRLDAAGQTALLVARGGQVLGVIGARDRLRSEAAAILAELRGLGIVHLALLTGDRAAVARTVAGALGLTDVHAELLPQQKADFVAAWQEKQHVAMVGDGINDAPALARADVGLAVGGSGADVAAEAGDVVLMNIPGTAGVVGEPLRALPLLVRLSRETVRIIRQNILVFAFGINLLGIVLTAWLWPLLAPERWYEQGPIAAVVYHQLGSLAVLLNAMRLLWFERGVSHPLWLRWRGRVTRVNDWLEHRLDIDEAFHWLGHHWRSVTMTLGGLALLAFACSGLTQIQANEIGIVRRLGQPLADDLSPGLHWRWPWPLETVTRVQPSRIFTIEIGYRSIPGSAVIPSARAWSELHNGDGSRRLPEEAVMMTGDGNLLEVQGTVRYTIAQPRVFLFEFTDAAAILRDAAESVLRETVAGRKFADLLTTDRARFQELALERLRQRCLGYGPHGLGLQIEGVALHDLHPPQEVVLAYHEVTKAMETRDRRVHEEEASMLLDVSRQEGESLKTVRTAQAARTNTIALAEARGAEFLARWQARSRLAVSMELQLLQNAFVVIEAGVAPADAARDYQQRRRDALALQEVLSDFRRYWDSIGAALMNRDKVLLDADQVPGRRHLLLVPPDMIPMPSILPMQRNSMNPAPNRPLPSRPGEEGGRDEP
jgi:Cu+-exporting ATPase